MDGHTHAFEYVAGHEQVTPSEARIRVVCTTDDCNVVADQCFVRPTDKDTSEHVFQPSALVAYTLSESVTWRVECVECGVERDLAYEYERAMLTEESRLERVDT